MTLVLGIIGTAVLCWLQAWWWALLPLAGSFFAYELYFWSRGDRPVRLTLDQKRHRGRLGP